MDLEAFKKIPRNDVLIYLYENKDLDYQKKIEDIYNRINQPIRIFTFIIEDLINLKAITCKYFKPIKKLFSYFPNELSATEIDITDIGKDYVENMLLGYNTNKYHFNDSLNIFKYLTFSGHLSGFYQKDYAYFKSIASGNPDLELNTLYFLCTGKIHKENKDKKVFISYSWDSEEHRNWVSKLSEDLSIFDIEYDKNLLPGMSPLNYMKSNILGSDYVIILFTPNYKKRVSEIDSGVNIEYSIVSEDLYRKISHGKYLPILKSGNKKESIPENMRDAIYFDFRSESEYQNNLNDLINHIKKF